MTIRILLFVFALFGAPSATAHHNWSALYDVESDIEFEGVIDEIVWRNPHVRVSFTVNPGSADQQTFTTESNSVASLIRMGVTEDLLAPGTAVRVAGYRSYSSQTDMFMNHLLLPSGDEVVFLRTADARWPDANRIGDAKRLHGGVIEQDFSKLPTTIFGVWTTTYGNSGSHNALGKDTVERTEKGQAAFELASLSRNDTKCSPKSSTLVMAAPYPIELINQGDTVIVHQEEYDSRRTVYMNVPHEDPGTAGVLGYSTGKMVGDTLTVTTTYGEDSTEQLHETFSLSDDHQKLNYTHVVVDSEMLVIPTVNKKWWQYQPGATIEPYDCIY